ncbi:MAG: MFS transporter, partial [Flavobacteriales bacterium]|nr:MFS transporter [Flavobacteriales bacterium]
MKSYNTTKVFIAACAGLAFFGVAMLSLGPILGPLNEKVAGANALPSTMSIGIILGTILFGPVVDRFGYKWLLIIGSMLLLAGLQVLAGVENINLLHAAMAMI